MSARLSANETRAIALSTRVADACDNTMVSHLNDVSWADAITAGSSAVTAVTAIIAGLFIWRQLRTLRQTNAMSVLVNLFERHQADLSKARRVVFSEISKIPRSELRCRGIYAVPRKYREDITNLAWFYDHVGLLVAERVVDLEPVAGYMGDSVITNWELLEPLITGERNRRKNDIDPDRWQWYFENLYNMILRCSPPGARLRQASWIGDMPSGRSRRLIRALRHRRMRRRYGPALRAGRWLDMKRQQFTEEPEPWAMEQSPPRGRARPFGSLRDFVRAPDRW